MLGRILTLAALLAALSPTGWAAAPSPASDAGRGPAAEGGWVAADMVRARLVSAVAGTGDLAEVPLGLQVRLAPGWKTYWRSPGDAGLPPAVDWTGSTGLASAEMAWPAPHRFTLFGIETFGYDVEVTFPISARPAAPGAPLDLRAGVDLLVCSDVCVPRRLDLALGVPAGPATPSGEANLVARARAAVPGPGEAAGLAVGRVSAAPGREAAIEIQATAREPFVDPDVFVEVGSGRAFGKPETRFSDDGRGVTLRLPLAGGKGEGDAAALVGSEAVLTLVDGLRAAEFRMPVSPPAPAAQGGLAAMLGVAVLGGLILNLMPCVLPVLSLKLLSAVKLAGAAPRRVRLGFLATAAGILASFLALAAALAGLKAAGAAVGWGIQFQQPLFLVFMTVLVTLFAANLWGLFEVPLPRALADAVGGRGGGAAEGRGGGLLGHFATGAFATLLATPCSAPFLGTAVGFALSRGPVEILSVFAALGLGLALPYLAVAAFPSAARLLPRPGRWMVTLRRVLGGALALTALWLLGVLGAQEGRAAALVVGAAMAAAVLALALARRAGAGGRILRPAAAALALLAFLVPFLPGLPSAAGGATGGAAREAAGPAGWAAFDRAALRAHVDAGRTVFVDVTAEWCITCQVNKSLVIGRGAVAERLFEAEGRVVPMRADWTRPDAAIADFLASFGRYGIPFNVVYGPSAPDGIVLPELLDERSVLDAIARAAGAPAGLAEGKGRGTPL
jgi:suppressor for copper-sensitivity B